MTMLRFPKKTQAVAPASTRSPRASREESVPRSLRASVWRNLRWLFAFSIAANLLLLTLPLHMIAVYDRVLVSRSSETLFYVTLVALGALILLGITEGVRMMIAQRMSARYVTGVAGPLFSALVHEEKTDNPRSQLMRDFYALRSFLSSKALIGLFDVPFAPLFLILLFVLHVQLGLVTLAGMLVLAGLALANRRMSAGVSEEATRSNADAVAFSQAVVSRPEDIRAMGLFTPFLSRWGAKMDTALTKADETARVQAIFFGLSRAIRQSLQVIIMAWGAALVLAGDLSGGIIFAASLISSRAFGPLEQTIGAWDRIDAARKALDNLSTFLDAATPPPRAVIPARTMGDIDMEAASVDVNVGGRSQTILEKASFSMKSGRILAVVGPSGAGKTTLAKLVAGALTPTVGSVRLDDFELALWPDARRGESIGYVPQDSRPFPGSIAENISRFEPYPDHDRIIDAATKAGIHNSIAKLPDAYATLVGPDTADLSGGQMQQLALARAYYARPRVLVLDEPNAHLDTQAEENLLRTLVALREEGVTTVVVSQRRSMLKIANHVLVLNEGRVVSYRENAGEWKERRIDGKAVDGKQAPPPSNINAAPGMAPGLAQKPEVTVDTLNQRKPRQKGAMRVEPA